MHFRLPQNLLQEVVSYDPVLKKVAVKAKASNSGKPRMSLGVPDDLFPLEFATREKQAEWARALNTKPDKERVMSVGEYPYGRGVLLYQDSTWYAFWFFYNDARKAYPDKLKGHDYLYGFSMAYRSTEASLRRNREISLGHTSSGDLLSNAAPAAEVKYGKVSMHKHTLLVTESLVVAGNDRIPLTVGHYRRYTETNRRKNSALTQWIDQFKETIPTWDDGHTTLARVAENGDIRKLLPYRNKNKLESAPLKELLIDYYNARVRSLIAKTDFLVDLLKTPFFSRELNNTIAEMMDIYKDPLTKRIEQVLIPFHRFNTKIKWVEQFTTIYPEASLDYCQQVYQVGEYMRPLKNHEVEGAGAKWLGQNMPIASFVQVVKRMMEKEIDSRKNDPTRRPWLDINALWLQSVHNLDDVLSMARSIAQAQGCTDTLPDIPHPKRWRLSELHDHLAAERFKILTPNEDLNQDLFPTPIKVEEGGNKWTFFQPSDVHQLALWGNAVRNCVGSASGYREGIKKKKHFIILAMLDSKPRFTIQLKVNNGVADVEQIADIGNRRLNDTERSAYEQAFKQALSIREQQLTAA